MTSPQPTRRIASTEELTADILLKASWVMAGLTAVGVALLLAGSRLLGL